MARWVWRIWDVSVAVVFAAAVIGKVLRPEETLSTFSWIGLGGQGAWAAVYLLLGIETLIIVRLLLLPTSGLRKFTVGLLVLFSLFLGYLWLHPEPPDCGCGTLPWLGRLDTNPLTGMLRNGTLLVGAMIAATANLGWNATAGKRVGHER